MSHNKETPILIVSFLITATILGGGVWWFMTKSGGKTNIITEQKNPEKTSENNAETIAQVTNIPKGKFFYGGSSTWSTIRKEVDPAIQIVAPQFQLIYKDPPTGAPSSDTGIKMLIDNQLDFSQSANPVPTQYYEQAKIKGLTLKEIPVAIDAIAVVVHPSLNIKGLTIKQIDDIYAGKITNWKKVGGLDLKITPYAKVKDAPSHIKYGATTTDILRMLANDPGGIFKASAPLVVPQCNVKPVPLGLTDQKFVPPYQEPLVSNQECNNQNKNKLNIEAFKNGEYPNTRRLFVVIKQDGQDAQKAGEIYAKILLTNQGQELIEKAGFVRIR
jgi:phosphate transport system substrate-binding protein